MLSIKNYFLINGITLFIVAILYYLLPNSNWLLNIDEVSYNFFAKSLAIVYGIIAINSIAAFLHLESSKFNKYFLLNIIAFNLLLMFNYYTYYKTGLLSYNFLFYLHLLLFLLGLVVYLSNIPKMNNEKL